MGDRRHWPRRLVVATQGRAVESGNWWGCEAAASLGLMKQKTARLGGAAFCKPPTGNAGNLTYALAPSSREAPQARRRQDMRPREGKAPPSALVGSQGLGGVVRACF